MPKEIAATAGQERCAPVLASNLSDGAVIAEVLADTARSYTLYRELQHRVKNNLQVIQSLVRLSAKRAPADLAEYFEEVRRQIWAIGHKLYAGGNLDHIDLSSYIGDILDQSIISFGSLNERVRVTKELEPISSMLTPRFLSS
jgi:two-component sensor histidine kinase